MGSNWLRLIQVAEEISPLQEADPDASMRVNLEVSAEFPNATLTRSARWAQQTPPA